MDHIAVNITTLSLLFFVCNLEAVKNSKFCDKNPNNTLCIYPGVGPGPYCRNYEEVKLTNSVKRDILTWHVQIRNNHEEVKSLGGVYWNEKLATIASKWASQCRPTKDSNRHFGNNLVGQNVFRVSGDENATYTVVEILKLSENNFEAEKSNGGETVSASTLRKWKGFLVGCGGSKYSAGESNATVQIVHELVCNYMGSNKIKGVKRVVRKEGRLKKGKRGTGDKKNDDLEEYDYDDEEEEEEYEDPISKADLRKEMERKIDDEFGPFGGFFEASERQFFPDRNPEGSVEIRLNKEYEDFENAGAAIKTINDKFRLWALRKSNGCSLRPEFSNVFAFLIIIFAYHLLTAWSLHG